MWQGRFLEGQNFCIPAKSGSFKKYIFRWIKEWIVPIFYKNPNPQQYLPDLPEKRTFLEHLPNNSISLDLISKENTQGLD